MWEHAESHMTPVTLAFSAVPPDDPQLGYCSQPCCCLQQRRGHSSILVTIHSCHLLVTGGWEGWLTESHLGSDSFIVPWALPLLPAQAVGCPGRFIHPSPSHTLGFGTGCTGMLLHPTLWPALLPFWGTAPRLELISAPLYAGTKFAFRRVTFHPKELLTHVQRL